MRQFSTEWTPDQIRDFGRKPLLLRHGHAENPLFADDALARLIEATPRSHFHVNTIDRDETDPRKWREGDMSGLSGLDVMAAVARGNIWVHLQRVHETSSAYRVFLDDLFADIERNVPGFRSYRRSMSVLISSPNMNVALHADVPGQSLWQVRGRKRVWVYPPQPPYLPQEKIEAIVLQRSGDTDLPYDPSYEAGAESFELEPGDWATWPRNAPHRVRNADCVNVSFTTEHWTDELRAGYAVDYANGLLRPLFRGADLSRETRGPAFMAKFAVAAAHKGWRRLAGRTHMPVTVDFRVDPRAAQGFADVAPHQIMK
ncbi:hypothetical protein [Methylocystis echinoides]|uniref:JmjC domain-containing protein n=1 Tax=Methylocystis echinoides TaxID=29468 RepID=A0A9W6GUV6_9HYPH|nr:hypothetical protein [Methylocystis echinoides]GLI93464.1 hypothetical protein LMG27198_24560 [Methylocystis echinoides]